MKKLLLIIAVALLTSCSTTKITPVDHGFGTPSVSLTDSALCAKERAFFSVDSTEKGWLFHNDFATFHIWQDSTSVFKFMGELEICVPLK